LVCAQFAELDVAHHTVLHVALPRPNAVVRADGEAVVTAHMALVPLSNCASELTPKANFNELHRLLATRPDTLVARLSWVREEKSPTDALSPADLVMYSACSLSAAQCKLAGTVSSSWSERELFWRETLGQVSPQTSPDDLARVFRSSVVPLQRWVTPVKHASGIAAASVARWTDPDAAQLLGEAFPADSPTACPFPALGAGGGEEKAEVSDASWMARAAVLAVCPLVAVESKGLSSLRSDAWVLVACSFSEEGELRVLGTRVLTSWWAGASEDERGNVKRAVGRTLRLFAGDHDLTRLVVDPGQQESNLAWWTGFPRLASGKIEFS
jgi:hypothetical protein